MQFGIDTQAWTTGPLFKGLKLIPPGTHYVHFAFSDEDYAARVGFFIHIPPKGAIIVKRWDGEAFRELPEGETVAY